MLVFLVFKNVLLMFSKVVFYSVGCYGEKGEVYEC